MLGFFPHSVWGLKKKKAEEEEDWVKFSLTFVKSWVAAEAVTVLSTCRKVNILDLQKAYFGAYVQGTLLAKWCFGERIFCL